MNQVALYVPGDVQREAHMPHATAQLDWELAEAISRRILASAQEVHFSYAKQNEAAEARPSRLIAQLAGDAALLGRLTVDKEHPYAAKAAQMAHVVALVEAVPSALSKRMKLIQSRLVGPQKAIVSVAPTAQAERWKGLPHVADVRQRPEHLQFAA